MKETNMIFFPSTLEQLNLILDKLSENEDYIAKIGNIEIGLAHKTKKVKHFIYIEIIRRCFK